eukprot:NODE_164_length_14719_cov_1.036252.p1 type:complete len:888 gc:universal NODE_164_length_14719_cov_1.036252:10962-13625(+)
MEQEEYKKEGIPWSSVDFIDNAPCIELISRKPIGVLALLDEESNFPKGTDTSLLTKLHQQCVESKYYVKPKQAKPLFSIVHYAGEVQYQIDGFIDKNKDTLRQEILELFGTSKVEIIQQLFASSEIPSNYDADKGITIKNATTRLRASKTDKKATAGAQKKATLGTQFSLSLSELMDTLGSCNPYFVRCVKPNQKKVCDRIDRKVVLDQLQYSGMLATVKVRKAGFPIRMMYTEFIRRYNMICSTAKNAKPKDAVDTIIKAVVATDPSINKAWFYLGASKLFMKQDLQNILERRRGEKFAVYAIRIQARWRGYKQRKEYLRDLFLVVRIQVKVRIFVRKIKFRRRMRSALIIQKVYKGYIQRKKFKKMLAAYRKQLEQKRMEEERARAAEEQAKLDQLNAMAMELPPEMLNLPPPPMLPDLNDLPPPPPMFFSDIPSYKYDEMAAKVGNSVPDINLADLPPPPTFPPPGAMKFKSGSKDLLVVKDDRRESVATTNLDDDDDVKVAEVALPDAIQDILDDLNDIFDDASITPNNPRKQSVTSVNSNLKKFIPKESKDGRISYQLPELIRKKLNHNIRLLNFGDLIPVVRVETHITAVRKNLIPDEHALKKVAAALFQDPNDFEYSKRKLAKSLLALDDSVNLIALRLNKTILKLTHETIDPKVFFHSVWYMAEEIRAHPSLKDEMICQVWKQINNCPNSEIKTKTWVILCLFLQCYIPSNTIKQGLCSFMISNSVDELGRLCLECLCRLKSEERKSPISGIEWIAITKTQMVTLPVETTTEESINIGLDGLATTKELVTAFGNFYGINGQGYSLELEMEGETVPFDSGEMVLDVIGNIEKTKNGVTPYYYCGENATVVEEEPSDMSKSTSMQESMHSSLAELRPGNAY